MCKTSTLVLLIDEQIKTTLLAEDSKLSDFLQLLQPTSLWLSTSSGLFFQEHLLQVAAFMHAQEDVTSTNKFPINVNLRNCWPF